MIKGRNLNVAPPAPALAILSIAFKRSSGESTPRSIICALRSSSVIIENLKFPYGSGLQAFSVGPGGIKEDLFDNLWTVIEGNKLSFLVSDLLSVLQAKEKVYNETRT